MGVKRRIHNLILRYLPLDIRQSIIHEHKHSQPDWQFKNISYSQEGEDMVLDRLFEGKSNGFFVDIGAHHPYRYSNTYKFYLRGWHGINIDPLPGSMELFNKERPLDINLEIGISKKDASLTYYMFNDPALNTFNKSEAERKNGKNNFFIIDKKEIETKPLGKVLSEYVSGDTLIDFISIDVEGFDLQVLQSNNWESFKPKFILIEELRSDIEIVIEKSEIYKFLNEKNYSLLARTYNTSFYRLVK